ncbi:MAG: hypothetical protein L0Y71_05370 [Gemmataceae bacterium]|nr:hypothetical protein [Gemmataceae bacterium]
MSTRAPQEHPVSLLGGVLSYLVPGLGQIVQGRIGKGLLFMVSLLGLFHLGQAMGDWKNVYIPITAGAREDERFFEPKNQSRSERFANLHHNLYQRWQYLGQFWIGIAAWPALWQYFDMPVPADESQRFWRNLQRAPSEAEINNFWVNSDKTPDLGWIYTVIAGVLNILVIYDAYAGPAHPGDPREPKKDKQPQETAA